MSHELKLPLRRGIGNDCRRIFEADGREVAMASGPEQGTAIVEAVNRDAAREKRMREVAEDMEATAERMRELAREQGIPERAINDNASRPAYFQWIEGWRAKLLEGLGESASKKEDPGT